MGKLTVGKNFNLIAMRPRKPSGESEKQCGMRGECLGQLVLKCQHMTRG